MMSSTDMRLPRATPESQGIASSAILKFVEAVEAQNLGLHSLMVARHGEVVAEGWWQPYAREHIHLLYSLSKSFTSTAVGLAAAEGHLSIDDSVISFFPEDTPAEASANHQAMKVRHLLSMSTGHAEDSMGDLFAQEDGNWIRGFLAMPVTFQPGTHFVYNSGASYMLSAIVQKQTGQTLLEYLKPRLLDPLGIVGATWENSPQGINAGGWGMSVKTEDIACFGQLYLQNGIWHGKQLLPEGWVEEATAKHIPNSGDNIDWAQGYGYQFWRCRHGAYRGDGAFGQFCVVMPEQQAVVAITSGTPNMQAVLDLVWEHLLPAMGSDPLEEDQAAQQALNDKLASLALPTQTGAPSAPIAAQASGQSHPVAPNEQQITAVRCDFSDTSATIVITDGFGEHTVSCGYGAWQRSRSTLSNDNGRRIMMPNGNNGRATAASGAWTNDTTYVVQICFYETPYIQTLTLRFGTEQVEVESRVNVSFG